MKAVRNLLVFLLALALLFGFGCAKKTIRSDAVKYTPPDRGYKADSGPEKSESASRDASAEADKKLEEENLREQALREQALRDKALQEEARKREAEAAAREAALKNLALNSVFFDFDQWSIPEEQKRVLTQNSEWLKAHPGVKIKLEGHCDERGTGEYNLALGQKRADAVKTFLEGMGISGQRLSSISYGKERPQDPGHNESAWAKNRRVDFAPIK